MAMMQAYLYCWNTRGVQINVFVVMQVGIAMSVKGVADPVAEPL